MSGPVAVLFAAICGCALYVLLATPLLTAAP